MHSVLERALNLSPEAIVVYEPVWDEQNILVNFRIGVLNDAAVRMFGISRGAATGQLLTDLWPVVDEESIGQRMRLDVLATHEPRSFEWYTEALGKPQWFEVSYQYYEGSVAASYRDITIGREALQKTEEQKAFYELLLRQSTSRKAILSPVFDEAGELVNFRYDYANYGKGIDDAHRHLPYFDVEIAGLLVTELLPTAKRTPIWAFYVDVFTKGKPMRTELWYRADGIDTAVDLSGQKFPDGRLLITYADITETHRLAMALDKERAQVNGIIEALPLGLTVFEAVRNAQGELYDLRLVRRNEEALRLSRVPGDIYHPGAMISELMPAELRENVALMLNVVRTGESVVHELYQPHLDKWISSRIMKHGDGLISTIQDITAIKRHANEMQRQAELLEGVLEASPNGISVFEAIRNEEGEIVDFKVVHANDNVIRVSGYDRETYMHTPVFERLDEHSSVMPSMKEVVEKRKPYQAEFFLSASGRYVHSSSTPLGANGVVNTIQDITDQKVQQEYISGQARMLEGVMQASPHAILVFEAIRNATGETEDFRIIRFNQKAMATTRLAAGQLSGSTLFTCMPQLRARLPQYVTVVESGEPEHYEFYNEKLNLWRRITNTPLADGFVMTMEDITEQKRISQQIEESAQLLNAVLDASPIAVVVYEALRDESRAIVDFRPIIANRPAIELSGMTAEAFSALTLLQRAPETVKGRLGQLREVVAMHRPEVFEHLDPSTGRWIRSITTPFGDGFIATAQDITELKAQTARIAEQAELFSGVLRSLQNGLSILRIIRDDEGTLADLVYIEVADSIERDTGMSRAEMKGRSMRTLFPGIEHTEYWKAYSEVARTGEPVSFETHFTLPGYDNYLLNWVTPIGHDKLVSVYYIFNDLKRTQRELEHTVHELRRSNEDLEQFASIASHDLQEPLRKVQSFGTMLESRYADALGEGGKYLVQRMQAAAGRMRNLVTGLLTFSRLSGDNQEDLRPVDLNSLIGDITNDLDDALQASGGMIEVPARLPFVLGLEGQLRQLFQNLLTNALKFCKKHMPPVATINTKPLETGDATQLSPRANPADYVRIEVADNGIGFEPQFAEKIFGLFERLHGMAEYQGTGIGLSISRRVADRHFGAIWAEGEPGVGARFVVLLQQAK